MEEKKLNDEEIIKAFENCNNGNCRTCEYRSKKNKDLCYHKKLNGVVIHLIRRLQTENEQLKAKNELDTIDIEELCKEREKRVEEVYADFMQDYKIMRDELNSCQKELVKECKEHEEFVNLADKRDKEHKAEIERLTEELEAKKKECREIADDYEEMGTFYYNETVKTTELQKQIEAWKAKLRELDEAWEIASSNEEKLRKQVDELKANQVVECHGILKGCDMVKQAVKDTAKEILQKIMDIIKKSDGFLSEEVVRIMAKQKGVEVE